METWALNDNEEWELVETWYYTGSAWESLQFGEYARLDEVWDVEATTTAGTPPTITQHPSSRTVLTGGSVTFNAAANGTAPITWTWHKNGGSAIAGAGGTGATTSYTLPAVTTGDAGSYVAKADNAYSGTPVSTNAAVLTVTVEDSGALARIGADGLVLAGVPGAHADCDHASAIQAVTGLDFIVIATSADWSAYWGDSGGNVQALLSKSDGGSDTDRSWAFGIRDTGGLVFNLSASGTAWAELAGTPSPALVDGSTYAFRGTWNKSDGATKVYAALLTGVNDTYPASWNVGSEAGDTPVATGTKLNGADLHGSPGPIRVGALNDKGLDAPFKGTIHYVEARNSVGGSPVWSCDFRNVTVDDDSFPDDTGARTITVRLPTSSGDAPVGMPLGTETPNVGPLADVLDHTPIAYADLASQTPSKVITTVVADARPTTEVTSDGVTRRVFELLNVEVCVQVTSTTPVLIRNSKMGRIEARNDTDVWVEWSDIGYGYARSGDDPCAAATIWDGTDSTFATSSSYNGMTTVGSGGDTITADAGTFTGECTSVSGSTDASKLTVYRCNLWGHTDANYTGGKVPGEVYSLAEATLIECWWHDYLWMPRDWSRRYQSDGGNSHCDGTKVNAGNLLKWVRCRVDMWPVEAADFADLEGPYWKGPHWGKNPNNSDWPLQRTDTGTRKFLPVAFIIDNQAGGSSKNVLIDDNLVSGPWGTFFQFGKKFAGTTYHENVTIRRNRFVSGITAGGDAFTNPRTEVFTGMNNWPSANKFHWPITGPDVNYINGVAVTSHPKSGMIDSSTFTAT